MNVFQNPINVLDRKTIVFQAGQFLRKLMYIRQMKWTQKQYFFRLFLTACFFSLLAACSSDSKVKKFKIGFSQCCDDAWRDVMNREMMRELAFHPELDFKILTANSDSEKQIAQIRELIDSGIDLLILAPNESKPLTAIVEETFKKGIPVILIDRKTESEQYTAYLGGDNYEIGLTAAKYMANQLNGRAKIIELEMMKTMSPAIDRHRGFKDGIRAFPEMVIVGNLEIKGQVDADYDQIKQLIASHPEVTAIYAQTDLLAETSWKIYKEIGLANDLFYIGIDGIPGTGRGIQAVEDGILDASLLYPTGGAEAIKLALTILSRLPFEKNNRLQTTVITPDNASILHAQMKKEASLQESIDKQIKAIHELRSIYHTQQFYILVLVSSLLLSIFLGAVFWQSLQAKKAANKSLEIKTREALEHEQQIMAMSEELNKATQSKVDFFTNISHEFRTPLTLILGFTEDLMPVSRLSKDVQQSIDFIRQNAYRLLRLVNQLMDFRKIESDRMRLRASEQDLTEFVRNTMKTYGKVAEKRTIDFQLITRHEHLSLWFDQAMLDKVLFNLLSNAFKFTPDGGKIYLSITVDSFENNVKIMVEDSGAGLTPEEAQHVFEVFYQGEGGQKAGSGLGLSLSKALVELHSGTLKVSSIKDKGSRFTIVLPLGNTHLTAAEMVEYPAPYFPTEAFIFDPLADTDNNAVLPKNAADQQLLIIEDNAELQFFLKRKLNLLYQITAATDANSGIQQAFDMVPDLIICDIELPNGNGLDIVRTLKSDLRTSHIPIILLTARSSVEQQIEGAKTGADAYITKPFNIQYLQEIIRNLLHNRQILKDSFGKRLVAFSESNLSEHSENDVNALDRVFIQKFTCYIDAHYARQDFQVADLCQEMNLSRSQLYRKIKALFGESISDYIQQVRLEKSRNLLLEGKLSVAEIAYQVGYSSPDYFSTVFRSKYNVAPSQIRKQK